MPGLMSQVDQLQNAEEAVEQNRQEADRREREGRAAELRREPFGDTASKAHTVVHAPLAHVRTMVNMRVGGLPDLHDLALSIKESGLLHPPLVRATDDAAQPYELLAGRRRFGAMSLLDDAEGERSDWRFMLVDGISRREALTMQFAENFHQNKPEPVQFARAARAIMAEDDALTAADVSRLVGAPIAWTRKALRLLDLPESIVQRVEQGDLSFTVADVVRRGIARGDVSEADASDLVEQHAEGEITNSILKKGVGYQPPKPKNYDELSEQLDRSRWAAADAAAGSARADGADQRDWDRPATGDRPRGPLRTDGPTPVEATTVTATGADAGGSNRRLHDLEAEDVDGYLLALVLARVVAPAQRSRMGIISEEDAEAYAFSLRPEERLGALRSIGARLLEEAADVPRALRSRVA